MAGGFADVPEAVDNTVDVARRCEFEFAQQWRFPVYQVPDDETLESVLRRDARRGLDERLNTRRTLGSDPGDESRYDQRLAFELDVINEMGFAGYFLIVADFINWAKGRGKERK